MINWKWKLFLLGFLESFELFLFLFEAFVNRKYSILFTLIKGNLIIFLIEVEFLSNWKIDKQYCL